MPRIFKIIFLVQVGVGAGVAGIVHACNFTVAGAGAFPRILKLSNILIARFSAHVIGHHLLGVVDSPRTSDEIMRAAQAMCGSGVGWLMGRMNNLVLLLLIGVALLLVYGVIGWLAG